MGGAHSPADADPHVTTIITGIFVAAWSLIGDENEIYDLTNIGTLFAFVLVCIGVLVLRYTDPDRPRPFRVPFVWPVDAARRRRVPLHDDGLPTQAWERFGIWLAVGLVLYFVVRLQPQPPSNRPHVATPPAVVNGEPRVWQARANPAGGRDLWPAAIVAIHALLFLTLAAWTWRKWPDPIVDFGRELYVPWQITRGHVLYRDIASLFGPLSPYVNAIWFRLFGVSLTTLVVCNLVIFAGVLAGVYRYVRLCADRMTAAAASLSTLLLFGFAHLVEIGNYNFAAPYSHEATHGLALSLVLLLCLARGVATREPTSWAIGGVCLGLVMLTKPETAVAAVVAVAAAISGASLLDPGHRRRLALERGRARRVRRGPASPVLPLLSRTDGAGRRVARHQRRVGASHAGAPRSERLLPARHGARSSDREHAPHGAHVPGVRHLRRRRRCGLTGEDARWSVDASARSAGGAGVGGGRIRPDGSHLLRAASRHADHARVERRNFLGARADRDRAVRLLWLAVWSAFALALLAKIGLNARIVHYGFYLGLPATVLTVVPDRLAAPRTD